MSMNVCYHCGDDIRGKAVVADSKQFCCTGCRGVYTLLKENQLDQFYALERNSGIKPTTTVEHKYAFLEVPSIRERYIEYEDANSARITLFLPQIHCSSCIYLLENLKKIHAGIVNCQVNFAKREASIVFHPSLIKLSELAQLLDSIGYAPNFGNRQESDRKQDKQYMYKLGVAGFAFGSIMLWSFPEYLGIEGDNPEFRNFTAYLSFLVSLPVLFYSASEYLVSAYKAIKFKSLNLDVPITIGIFALYIKSASTIFSGDGPGYMDSFAGFIFFLLIGKWFQNKTYKSLSFERDYTSYFPVAVTRLREEKEEIVEIEKLEKADHLILRNEEVIPCDSILASEHASIDYSFVTGESTTIHKSKGDFIYAGGKLRGQRTVLIVEKETNRSHLTQLWNETKSSKPERTGFLYQDKLSHYFLIALLLVALVSGIAWFFIDSSRITEIVVAILIVACPCALALSAPFTFGNTMRKLGRQGLYLKNTLVIERLNEITDIVFDKTGTLTATNFHEVQYVGDPLSATDCHAIVAICQSSAHPHSKGIVQFLTEQVTIERATVTAFIEQSGKGIQGVVNGKKWTIGSANFVSTHQLHTSETATYVAMDNHVIGRFIFTSKLREGIAPLIKRINSKYTLHVLSGDNNQDKGLLEKLIPLSSNIRFNQGPADKLEYIKELQTNGKKVLMIGDGLNDSVALETAHVGIAVSEDVFRFTPSSDAIIDANKLEQLDTLLSTAHYAKVVLKACLIFSLAYNTIGLSFAISDQLTPLVAAILMPISSISVVLISTMLVFLNKPSQ